MLTGMLLAGSLILALAVGGCGGGGDQSIDKAAFAEQANSICEKVSGTMAAGLASITKRESTKPGYDFTKTQAVVVKEALVPGLEEELAKIRALGVPTDAAREAKALLQEYERAITKTKANSEALANGAIPYEGVELTATRIGASECPVAPVGNG